MSLSFIETCRHLVGLDSTPSRGTLEIGRYAARLCQDAGLAVECDPDSLNGLEQLNVIARPGPVADGEFMLQAHLDTVDPGHFSAWTQTQSNPFSVAIYGDLMFGLGVADTKLDFLCKLEAIKTLGSRSWRRPFVLVGTYGAQLGMAGAVKLMRRKRVKAKAALVGAPTNLNLAFAGQGLAVVEIAIPFSEEEIDYREKHDQLESGSTQSKMFLGSSEPRLAEPLAENAIVKMLEYLVRLPEGIAVMDLDGGTNYATPPLSSVLEIDVVGGFRDPIVPKIAHVLQALRQMELTLRAFPAPGFDPAHPTLNIGLIRTQQEAVSLTGICRLPPSVTDQDYRAWIGAIREECDKVGATFTVKDYKSAFRIEADSLIVRTGEEVARSLGLPGSLVQVPASTEANVFSRFGIDCLVMGPGQGVGNSQAPDERINMNDLYRVTDFYRRMLEEFCL